MATTKADAQKRKAKTAAEIRADIKAAEQRLAKAEAKEYGATIEAMIEKLSIKADFVKLKDSNKGASELLILELIGKAVGIKRLLVSQSDPVPRKSKAK